MLSQAPVKLFAFNTIIQTRTPSLQGAARMQIKSIAIVLAISALCAPAHAQKLYRCGNTFQDRPCDANLESNVIGNARSSQPAPKAVDDAQCAQRGQDAQKIMWAREAGQTVEVQLSKTGSTRYSLELIKTVYLKRGTAMEVRVAIEEECVAEKERALQARTTRSASDNTSTPDPISAATAPHAGKKEADSKAADARRQQQEADAKKSRCDSINAEQTSIRDRQRAGGSAGQMDALSEKMREIEKRRSENKC